MVLATSQQELSQFHGVRASKFYFSVALASYSISTPTLASERADLYIDFFYHKRLQRWKEFPNKNNAKVKTVFRRKGCSVANFEKLMYTYTGPRPISFSIKTVFQLWQGLQLNSVSFFSWKSNKNIKKVPLLIYFGKYLQVNHTSIRIMSISL